VSVKGTYSVYTPGSGLTDTHSTAADGRSVVSPTPSSVWSHCVHVRTYQPVIPLQT